MSPRNAPDYVVDDRGHHTPCWIWQGVTNQQGYGIRRIPGWRPPGAQEKEAAHRYAYRLYRGKIPEGLVIDHLCRVRSCVNPWHLEPVTPATNTRRGRAAKLTSRDVDAIRASNEPLRVLAERHGVSMAQVSRVRNGRQWVAA